jgi:hypothetical protein
MVHKKIIAISVPARLPVYKIANPLDTMPVWSVPNSKLQKPSRGDSRKVYG